MLIIACDQCKKIVTGPWRVRVRPPPDRIGEYDFCSPECIAAWFAAWDSGE